jgi:hypothetical protein
MSSFAGNREPVPCISHFLIIMDIKGLNGREMEKLVSTPQ